MSNKEKTKTISPQTQYLLDDMDRDVNLFESEEEFQEASKKFLNKLFQQHKK